MTKRIFLCAALAAALALGGLGHLYMTSPEYALSRIIADVEANGMEGLYAHLTDGAGEILRAAVGRAEGSGLMDLMRTAPGGYAAALLKRELAEVEWTVEDVLRSGKRADIVIGFRYGERLEGTVRLAMIRTGRAWRIEGIGMPRPGKSEGGGTPA